MTNTKTPTVLYSLTRPYYATIAMLNVLLDRSNLTNNVKAHCKLGLKVIGIIHADLDYNTGTHLLYKKVFDAFFIVCPTSYFNNRELISITMIIENIEVCIKTNSIAPIGLQSNLLLSPNISMLR